MFIVNNLNSIAVKDDFNGRWRSFVPRRDSGWQDSWGVTRVELAICISKSPILPTLTKNEVSFRITIYRDEESQLRQEEYYIIMVVIILVILSEEESHTFSLSEVIIIRN